MTNVQKTSDYILRFCAAVALSVSSCGAEAKAPSAAHRHEPAAVTDVVARPVLAQDHADDSEPNAEGVRYTCPMHPEVVRESPGRCPHCDMKLVLQEQRPKITEGS
jgi:hypothetical protein